VKKINLFIYANIFVLTFSLFSYPDSYPERIISLSPSITEIIYGIGAMEKIVGVTLYTDFPPEAKNLPNVGGWVNPNLEAIIELQPDLVLLMTDQYEIFGDKIKKLGLNTLSVDSNTSIEDIQKSIIQIGMALGKEKEARELSAKIETIINEARTKTSNLPTKRVLFVIGRNPGTLEDVYVIGNNNYINELLTVAGGENVITRDRLALKITKESILTYDPDVIIEVNHEKEENREEILQAWNGMKEAKAVKYNNIYIVSSYDLLHPSQRIIEGLGILAHILHPEIFDK
jgi:iron complex transport system substrate-binding protein